MQYLNAVNYLLKLTGNDSVADVESLQPDVQNAVARLAEASDLIQSEGWWFNTEYKWEITPDSATKEIAIPTTVKEASCTSRHGVVKRGLKAYDSINHTYQFDAPLTFTFVVLLDWSLLEDVVQYAIQFLAAALICANDLEDITKQREQEKFLAAKLSAMKKTNLRVQRRNIMLTPRVLQNRSRVRPYRETSGGTNPLYPGG